MLWDIFYGRHLQELGQLDSQDSNFVRTRNDRSCSESTHHPTCSPAWLLCQCAAVLSRWHQFGVRLTVDPNRIDHLLKDQHSHLRLPTKLDISEICKIVISKQAIGEKNKCLKKMLHQWCKQANDIFIIRHLSTAIFTNRGFNMESLIFISDLLWRIVYHWHGHKDMHAHTGHTDTSTHTHTNVCAHAHTHTQTQHLLMEVMKALWRSLQPVHPSQST